MIVPLALITAAALALPMLLLPRHTRSHRRVALGILVCAVCLCLLALVVFVLFDPRNLLAGRTWAEMQVLLALAFRASLTAMLIWVPILALVWFNAALRVERLRGEDLKPERDA